MPKWGETRFRASNPLNYNVFLATGQFNQIRVFRNRRDSKAVGVVFGSTKNNPHIYP